MRIITDNLCQSIIVMPFALLMISGDNSDHEDSKAEDDSKIVGGFDITLDKAPFLASLQKPMVGHFCGASLVTFATVLTGCHCLAVIKQGMRKNQVRLREWANIMVYVGSENIDEPNELSQHSKVRDVRIHPNCSFDQYLIYDFGVLFVASPFKKSPTVQPFEFISFGKVPFDLQTKDLTYSKEMECFVAGWGTTRHNSNQHSFRAKSVRMMIISDAECSEKLGRENNKFKDFHFSHNAQMCSLSFGLRKNASDCIGDSGGPFFCGKNVFAIVSYGYDCGFWDTPNVYAKLSYFVEWYATIDRLSAESTPRSAVDIITAPSILVSPKSSASTLILRSLVYIILQIYII